MFLKVTDADGLWSKIKNHVGVKVKHPVSPATRNLQARTGDPGGKKSVSVCPYCAVGCSTLVYSRDGRIIDIEGNPDSPINAGTLCPKGSATFGMMVSPHRWIKVKYRRPYSDHWEDLSLDEAMDMIADRVIIQGSNMAEAHPVGFRHPMIAREKGATLIHVDPRFTRTSAMCDIYAPIRPGTDIAFLGGLINYVLENERYFEEYVKVYTNAATIITEDFEGADASGLFSGWDEDSKQYDPTSWRYEGHPIDYASVGGSQGRIVGEAGEGEGGEMHPDMPRPTDMSLEHP